MSNPLETQSTNAVLAVCASWLPCHSVAVGIGVKLEDELIFERIYRADMSSPEECAQLVDDVGWEVRNFRKFTQTLISDVTAIPQQLPL
jgi:hypothetical protein